MRDFSSIAARFEGAFSDYEIHLSTQMSGYFIITKRGGYSSELIGEEVGELVFKDCTKTSDEIRAYICEKTHNKQENAPKSSNEDSLSFEIKEDKEAINEKPSAPAFSIEFEETKPAFEIIDENIDESSDDSLAFKIQDSKASKALAFEIIDENSDGAGGEDLLGENSKDAGDECLVGESSVASFEIIDDEDAKNSGENLVDENLVDESLADEIQTSQTNQSLVNDEIIIPAHHDSQKIFFAKNIEIISAKVVEIELIIHGYDESCDSFSFEKIPPDCEYKYSIKIGELRAIFIATMDAESASEFISGFSFKTERQVPKNIEIFINESVEPVLEITLFA
ncbi:DUF5416 family protein [Campylobacter sp.]|uniref:DUF5416 family protein n=2 Tax=Campylobacter sp. TaxID=205 RepID=UPI002A7F69F2|nr:DUF5416 family protein [Campylobacter sp.]MCI6662169.1 hypothetical protein [Campylobacter sp.]MCI7582690.1 hypothetical protein [Campylobacter sp.]MDY4155161.1 DUF5416 family protein [Campylobacter sp.]